MIKGVNRQVLEVTNTENPYFDRILFIVKAEYKNENTAFLQSEAEKFSKEASKPPKFRKSNKEKLWCVMRAFLGLGAGAGIVLMLNNFI